MIDELLYDLSAEEALVVAMETANYCVTYIQWTESSTLSDGEPEVSGRVWSWLNIVIIFLFPSCYIVLLEQL